MTAPYEPGDWIDGWVVDRVLGHGSAGAVYACYKEVIPDLTVVMKTLVEPTEETQAAFAALGQRLHHVRHPNVVRLRDIRAYEAPRFMLMDLVEGEPLSEYLARRGSLSHGRVMTFARQLAEAVEAIHKVGLTHNDIRPDNLIVSPDGETITLVDFGTLDHRDPAHLTRRGLIKPALAVYAPPEWLDGKADPHRWDIYSIGVVIHEMLTGKPPVLPASDQQGQLLQAIAMKRKTAYHDPGPAHPDELREVIRWCTQSDWNTRPDNAREIIWSLEDFLDRTEINPSSVMPAATRADRPSHSETSVGMDETSLELFPEDFDEQRPTVVGRGVTLEPHPALDPDPDSEPDMPAPTPRKPPEPEPALAARPTATPAPAPVAAAPVVVPSGPPPMVLATSMGLGALGGLCLMVSVVLVVIALPGLTGSSTTATAAPAAAPAAAAVAPPPAPEPVAAPEPEPEPEPTGPVIVEDELPSDFNARTDKKKAYLAIDPPEGLQVEVFFIREGEPDASIGKAPFTGAKYERGLRPFFPELVRGIRVVNKKAGIDESWDPHELQSGKALRWKVQLGP